MIKHIDKKKQENCVCVKFILLIFLNFFFINKNSYCIAHKNIKQCEEIFSKICFEIHFENLSEQQECFANNQFAFSEECQKYFSKKLSVVLQKDDIKKNTSLSQENNKSYDFAMNLLFSTYCKMDAVRFCRINNKKNKNKDITQIYTDCANKLKKRSNYLTNNCRSALYTAITGKNEKYTNYYFGNIRITNRQNLNKITEEQAKNGIFTDLSRQNINATIDDELEQYIQEEDKNNTEKMYFSDGSWIYKKYWLAVNNKFNQKLAKMSETGYTEFIKKYLKDNNYIHSSSED